MRLINVKNLTTEDFSSGPVPAYAILSHTWGPDAEELSFADLVAGNTQKPGLGSRKLEFCRLQALQDGVDYVWNDTCCIDKTNLVELTEAINSMFRWYSEAKLCYVYLSDVNKSSCSSTSELDTSIIKSRWFTRGWTLQELLAPPTPKFVRFFDSNWELLGTKGQLASVLATATGIPRHFLLGFGSLKTASVAQRMSWASRRETKRPEDMAYCLIGIFDVSMPMIYGEGGERAFLRLQEYIMRTGIRDDSILAWQSSSDWGGPQPSLAAKPRWFRSSGEIKQNATSLQEDNYCDILTGGDTSVSVRLLGEKSKAAWAADQSDASTSRVHGNHDIAILSCGTEAGHVAIRISQPSIGGSGLYHRLGGPLLVLPETMIQDSVVTRIRLVRHGQDSFDKSLSTGHQLHVLLDSKFEALDLEQVEVEPATSWDPEEGFFKNLSRGSEGDGESVATFVRLREKGADDSPDFIICLDCTVSSEQRHGLEVFIMTCSRETRTSDISRQETRLRHKWCKRTKASNGLVHLEVYLQPVAGQPLAVVVPRTLSTRPEPEEIFEATGELFLFESLQELASLSVQEKETMRLRNRLDLIEDEALKEEENQKRLEAEIKALEQQLSLAVAKKASLREDSLGLAGHVDRNSNQVSRTRSELWFNFEFRARRGLSLLTSRKCREMMDILRRQSNQEEAWDIDLMIWALENDYPWVACSLLAARDDLGRDQGRTHRCFGKGRLQKSFEDLLASGKGPRLGRIFLNTIRTVACEGEAAALAKFVFDDDAASLRVCLDLGADANSPVEPETLASFVSYEEKSPRQQAASQFFQRVLDAHDGAVDSTSTNLRILHIARLTRTHGMVRMLKAHGADDSLGSPLRALNDVAQRRGCKPEIDEEK